MEVDAKELALQYYTEQIELLKRRAAKRSISPSHFNKYILFRHFFDLHIPSNVLWSKRISGAFTERMPKKSIVFIVFMTFVAAPLICIQCKQTMGNLFMKHIQPFIYSGMSMWRLITLPILSIFPGLSKFYDESCLLTNPLFEIQDLNCLPCTNVLNVLDLKDMQLIQSGGVPYVFKTESQPFTLTRLHELFLQHKNIFRQDAHKIQSTNSKIRNFDDLFSDFQNQTAQTPSHSLWRCNRMKPLRLIRRIIRHPTRLPRTGMSIERFLAIDTENAPTYAIPDPDCSNVFVYQLLGTRTVILRPTAECARECRTISVRLSQSHVLMYDWWYWKPVSVADKLHLSHSISYIGAYC